MTAIDGDSPLSMNSWSGTTEEFTALSWLKIGENLHNAFIRKALPESLWGMFLSVSNHITQESDAHAFL